PAVGPRRLPPVPGPAHSRGAGGAPVSGARSSRSHRSRPGHRHGHHGVPGHGGDAGERLGAPGRYHRRDACRRLVILRALLLALSTRRSFGDALERVPGARAFVRRFVAGTRAADALAVMERLRVQKLMMAVTYLGENV